MSRARGAVLVLSVLLLAVGCAPEPVAAPTTAPPPRDETPVVEPVVDTDPVIAFDGDCAQMLTLEQRDALLGSGSMTAQEQRATWDPEGTAPITVEPIGTLGGLECSWGVAEDSELPEGVASLTMSVLPVASVPREFAAKYSTAYCEPSYDSGLCRLGRTVGENWVMATVGWAVYDAPRALLSAAVGAVAENLPAGTHPVPAALSEAVWSIPDCTELMDRIRLDELIGAYRHGYWEGSEQPEEVLFAAAGVARGCPLFSDSEQIDLATEEFHILTPTVLPGAAWQWDRLLADSAEATEIHVPGATAAIAADWGYGTFMVYATDGTNIASLYISDVELGAQILGRMIGELDATA